MGKLFKDRAPREDEIDEIVESTFMLKHVFPSNDPVNRPGSFERAKAKCEGVKTPTNGIGIARTISRLKRGWIGVYVTTSPFSVSVQKEVLDDQSPIMLINGLQVVKAVQAVLYREGCSIEEYLSSIEREYPDACKNRRPEEILFE